MTAYPRPVLHIQQVEITSRCNLACKYCPHPGMPRPKLDMDEPTLLRVIGWLRYFASLGTQGVFALCGIGEPLFHPDLVRLCWLIRRALPHQRFFFSTNGLLLTDEIAAELALMRVWIDISLHRPEKAGLAIEIARRHNILGTAASYAATASVDWAGQVDWPVMVPRSPCPWLHGGGVSIMADGRVTTCCFDTDGCGVIGHVDDPYTSVWQTTPFRICSACHHDP